MVYTTQTPAISRNLHRFPNFSRIFLLAFLVRFCSSFEAIIIHPNRNPNYNLNSILQITEKFGQTIEWHICNSSSIINCFDLYPSALIVLDLSDDLQLIISEYCKQYKKVHLAFENKFSYFDDMTYYMIPSYSDKAENFLAILKYFGWNQGLVIFDIEKSNLKNDFLKFSSEFNYLVIESGAIIDDLVSRFIMPMGTTLYYLFMEFSESLELQNSLVSKKLLADGNGIILDQESGYNCSNDGSIIITETGYEFVSSKEEYFQISLEKTLDLLLNYSTDTYENFNTILKNHHAKSNFSLINIQSGKRIIVGFIIGQKVTIFRNLAFPGDTTAIPKSAKKILHLSIEAGTTNPNSTPMTVGYLGSFGTYVAKDMINEGITGILQNFQVQFFNFDCGVTIYIIQTPF